MVQTRSESLPVPSLLDTSSIDIWVEQQVWGHRLHNDQTPWLLLLEAVNLMAFRAQDHNDGKRIFVDRRPSEHENLRYELRRARRLRELLFADRNVDRIADGLAVSDAASWKLWFDTFGSSGEADFGYVKERFVTFSSFRNAVVLLRGSEIEPQRRRRLTSRHLAPRGPAMLAADYGESRKGKGPDKDRRFFARGGELLFMMLNRSGSTVSLEPLIKDRLLGPNGRWNLLAKRLEPKEPEGPVTFENIGYLPLAEHASYRTLGEDWTALLSLRALPDDNLSEPLMRLSAVAVIRYILERAADVLGQERPLMPIDAMGPNTAGMRKLSRDALALHRDMTRKTVEKVIDSFVASEAWEVARSAHNPMKAARDLMKDCLGFKPKDEGNSIDDLPQVMKEAALTNHNEHLGLVSGFYAEQIGMAARRGATRWYVLSDPMLEALVLANVKEPMEYETFLERLHERYGFVIGSEVARRCYSSVNSQQVKANQRHLEERLRLLGLSKRLSDDCAFVVNPFCTGEALQ